jgi:uncharacterized protein
MGLILSSLVDLQAIENQVRRTEKELRKGQRQVKQQQCRIEHLQATIRANQEEIKLARMQYDKLELDLKVREERIAHMRVALNSAKTNKEYSTVLTGINTDKADNAKLEDQILALITHIDSDQAACKEIEENISQESEKLKIVCEDVEKRQKVTNAELEKQLEQRREVYQKVPAKFGVMFDRLAERYDGEVLAAISQLNGGRGDYSCGGCYMKVPLEVANSLMTRDDVIICPTCGRILVLDKNPKQTSSA